MLKFKKFLFVAIFGFAMLSFNLDAFAVAITRLSTILCGPGTGSAQLSLDGSTCDANLVCDTNLNICVNMSETACIATDNKGGGCTIGQKCTTGTGVATAFQVKSAFGICMPVQGGSAENNALGDVVCNVYRLITGKVGRGIVVVVLFATGISFYLGKVNWGTIVAIVIGAGLCFGGPAIVSVFLGKDFLC